MTSSLDLRNKNEMPGFSVVQQRAAGRFDVSKAGNPATLTMDEHRHNQSLHCSHYYYKQATQVLASPTVSVKHNLYLLTRSLFAPHS